LSLRLETLKHTLHLYFQDYPCLYSRFKSKGAYTNRSRLTLTHTHMDTHGSPNHLETTSVPLAICVVICGSKLEAIATPTSGVWWIRGTRAAPAQVQGRSSVAASVGPNVISDCTAALKREPGLRRDPRYMTQFTRALSVALCSCDLMQSKRVNTNTSAGCKMERTLCSQICSVGVMPFSNQLFFLLLFLLLLLHH